MNPSSSSRKRVRPLRARLKEAASEAILNAAEEVIAERGVERASMGEIATRAGVAVGTVYNYFPDRDGLVRALFRSRRARIVPGIAAAAAARRDQPFEPRLRGLLADLFALFEQHRRFLRVVMETDDRRPVTTASQNTVLSQLLGDLRQVFEAGEAEGRLSSGQHDRLARLAAGAMRGLLFHQLERGGSLEGEAAFLADVLLSGAPGLAASS